MALSQNKQYNWSYFIANPDICTHLEFVFCWMLIYGSHIRDWSRMREFMRRFRVQNWKLIKDVRYSWCLSIMEMGEADHSKAFGLYELFLMCIIWIIFNVYKPYPWQTIICEVNCTFTDSKSVHCRTVNIPLIFHLYLIKKKTQMVHHWVLVFGTNTQVGYILKSPNYFLKICRLIKKS